jgi:hypothetical protein
MRCEAVAYSYPSTTCGSARPRAPSRLLRSFGPCEPYRFPA